MSDLKPCLTEPQRTLLRKLVDVCYEEFTEQPGAVPSTQWADYLIDSVITEEAIAGCPHAGNAELLREIAEQASRETAWARKFDEQIEHFAIRVQNERRRILLSARRIIRRLRQERDNARLDAAQKIARIHANVQKHPEWSFYQELLAIWSDSRPDGAA